LFSFHTSHSLTSSSSFSGRLYDLIVQLPWVVAEANRLQISLAHGFRAAESPVEFLVRRALLAMKYGQQRLAGRRLRLATVDLAGVFRTSDIDEGRRNVDDVPHLIGHARIDHAGPVGNERRARAPFIVRRLEFPIRRVAGVGPADRNGAVTLYRSGRNARRRIGLFRAGPVVGEEHDQRVIPLVQLFHLGKQASQVLIHPVDHGAVDRHFEIFSVLLLLGKLVPGLGRPRRELVIWADDPHLLHPLEALLADDIPADLELSAVLGDILGPGVQRVMGRGIREIEQKRFVLAVVFVEPLDRVSGEGIGGVEVLVGIGIAHDHFVFDRPPPHAVLSLAARRPFAFPRFEARIEEVAAAIGQSVVAVEAASGWQRALMPLAGDQRAVAGVAQDFAKCGPMFQVVVSDRVGIVSGEQLGASRVALGRVVELGETQAMFGQHVDVRRLDLAAITTDVRVAHVIDHDQNDVGPRAVGRREGNIGIKQAEDGEQDS